MVAALWPAKRAPGRHGRPGPPWMLRRHASEVAETAAHGLYEARRAS